MLNKINFLKRLSIVCFIMIIGMSFVIIDASESKIEVIDSGNFGVDWVLYNDGTLDLEGGVLYRTQQTPYYYPWSIHRNKIKKIVLNGEIKEDSTIANLFKDLTNLSEIVNIENYNTSKIRYMDMLFYGNKELTFLDLSSWDVSNVVSMSSMFRNTINLKHLDVSGWDVSNVTRINSMFEDAKSLESLDLSMWNTESIVNLNRMFLGAKSLVTLDLEGWKTQKVTSIDYMFENAENLEELNISDWDTGNVQSLYSAFKGASKLNIPDLSSWDVSNVTNFNYTFYGVKSIDDLNIRFWDVSNSQSLDYMFSNIDKIDVLDLSRWDISNVLSLRGMLSKIGSINNINISNWKVNENVNTSGVFMFSNILELNTNDMKMNDELISSLRPYVQDNKVKGIETWDVSAVTNLSKLFSEAKINEKLDLSSWDTSNVKNMSFLFSGVDDIEKFDFSTWDVSKVEDMSNMFSNINILSKLDISKWNTKNLKNISYMFSNVKEIGSLDLSNLNISKLVNVRNIFYKVEIIDNFSINNWNFSDSEDDIIIFEEDEWNMKGFRVKELDTSGIKISDFDKKQLNILLRKADKFYGTESWNTELLTSLEGIFRWLDNVDRLDLSNWNLENVKSIVDTFDQVHLKELILKGWDLSAFDGIDSFFNGLIGLETIDLTDSKIDDKTLSYLKKVLRHNKDMKIIGIEDYKKDINTLRVLPIPNEVYDGMEKKPYIIIFDNDEILENDIDYRYDIKNNINSGLSTVVVQGLGIYKSNITLDFIIDKAELYVAVPPGIKKVVKGTKITEISVDDLSMCNYNNDEVNGSTQWLDSKVTLKTSGYYELEFIPSNDNYLNYVVDVYIEVLDYDGWVNTDKGWKYYQSNREVYSWNFIDGKWYYFNNDGLMHTGWKNIIGKWYYMDSSGVMQTGWSKLSNKWYYMSSSGVMQTGWNKLSNKWYYMDFSGVMQTSWNKLSNKWYYMDSSGVMQTGWNKLSNKWYYMDSSGVMQTGWNKLSNKWYYMNSSGEMQTGWYNISGKWYYFYTNGIMASNTTIGGYRISSSGAMI